MPFLLLFFLKDVFLYLNGSDRERGRSKETEIFLSTGLLCKGLQQPDPGQRQESDTAPWPSTGVAGIYLPL